jgi:type IX secretion system PorP/SprF family membrane protein
MLGWISLNIHAQNDVQYTHFVFNKLAYNAAFAGNNEVLSVNALYRHQWVDIQDAPKTFHINAHMPFAGNRSGIGLSVTTDKIGLFQTNFVDLYYAYRIPLGGSTLAIGLNGRVEHGTFNYQNAQGNDPGDIALPDQNQSRFLPNFGAGIQVSNDRYFVGLSMNQFLNNHYYLSNNVKNTRDITMKTIYLMGGVKFDLGEKVAFQPSVMVSHNPSAPLDVDMHAGFIFLDLIYTGFSYRLEDSVDFLFMYQLTKQFRIGAAYDFILSDLSTKTPGSFEFFGQYNFGFGHNQVKHIRYF